MRGYPVVPQYNGARFPLNPGLQISAFVDVIVQEFEDGFLFSSVCGQL